MGEIADFYIDRMINTPFSEGKSREGNSNKYIDKYRSLNDQELMLSVKKAIRGKGVNENFIRLSEKILQSYSTPLSEKQRNCFLGLLNVKDDRMRHLYSLSDKELLVMGKEALEQNLVEEKYKVFGLKIIQANLTVLTDKQRSGLLGLLSW